MKDEPLLPKVLLLFSQGRQEEATELFRASVPPEERAERVQVLRVILTVWREVGPDFWAIMARAFARHKWPDDHQKSVAWDAVADLPLDRIQKIWHLLPDPLKAKGRPRGRGVVAEDEGLFAEIDRLAATPEEVPAVVRTLVPEMAHVERKNRVDHVVKTHRKRGKK